MDYAYLISFGICFFFFFANTWWQLHKINRSISELRFKIETIEQDIDDIHENFDNLSTRLRIKNGKS